MEDGPQKYKRTVGFFIQSGITLDDLDNLGVIHVAGTKGKGSTCAMSESILRQRGLKTGLFTSPHMVSFRERIRINGDPIDKNKFAHYFWNVYHQIVTSNAFYDRPMYFQFLTVLAYKIFLHENVDVAIIEGNVKVDVSFPFYSCLEMTFPKIVGVGGRYDATNVVRNPIVCGVTTLDIDHTNSLGNTIEEIAWQKAGIMKPGRLTIVDGFQRKVRT